MALDQLFPCGGIAILTSPDESVFLLTKLSGGISARSYPGLTSVQRMNGTRPAKSTSSIQWHDLF